MNRFRSKVLTAVLTSAVVVVACFATVFSFDFAHTENSNAVAETSTKAMPTEYWGTTTLTTLNHGETYWYTNTDGTKTNYTVNVQTTIPPVAGSYKLPYKIDTPQNLQFLSTLAANDQSGAVYVLTADLDMSGYLFNPIGSLAQGAPEGTVGFRGTFHGQNHVIRNANISYPASSTTNTSLGLFGQAYGATITDLAIDNTCQYVTIPKVTDRVGGFAGYASNTNFINCHNYASMTLNWGDETTAKNVALGGIAGFFNATNFYFCGNAGNLTATGGGDPVEADNVSLVGGIGGATIVTGTSVKIANCYNYGNIKANVGPNVGGLLGQYGASTNATSPTLFIENCYVFCDVSGVGNTADKSWAIGQPVNSSISNLAFSQKNIFANGFIRGEEFTNSSNLIFNPDPKGLREAAEASLDSNFWNIYNANTNSGGTRVPTLKMAPRGITFNINYELNGGTFKIEPGRTYNNKNGAMGFGQATKAGYTLAGWYFNDGSLASKIVEGEIGDKTLYAEWALNAPTISVAVNKENAAYGDKVTLAATASHPLGGLTFQWYKDNVALSGKTGATLTFDSAKLADSGTYKCIVTVTDGTETKTAEASKAVTISKKTLNKPTGGANLTYNGNGQTYTLNGVDTATMTVSGNTGTLAADYTAVVALKDPANYQWTGGTTANVSIPWKILKKGLAKPTTAPTPELIWDMTEKTLVLTGFDDATMTVSGNTGTDAKDYTAVVVLKDKKNYQWADDGKADDVLIKWTIKQQRGPKPTVTPQSFVYNGAEQTLVINGLPEEAEMDLNGTITGHKAKNAGNYVAKFTLTNQNLVFEDGTREVTFNWSIAAATPVLTLPSVTGNYCIGQKLSAVVLSGGSAKNPANAALAVAGGFAFSAPDTEIRDLTGEYEVTFTPTGADADNYNTAKGKITVTAEQLTVTFAEDFKGTITTKSVNAGYGSTLAVADFAAITVHAGYTGAYSVNAAIENITENKTVNVTYTANTNTAYAVWHFKQNADGSWSEAASVAEDKTGTTDTTANAEAKSFEGFTFNRDYAESVLSGNIAGEGTLVLKLYYERNEHTVFLNLRGGSGVNYITGLYGSTVARPAAPTRSGYAFGGFYKDSACTQAWKFADEANADLLTENITLFAKWNADSFTIRYESNRTIDGKKEIDSFFHITEAENPTTYSIETESFALAAPSAEGHNFGGWYIEGTNTRLNQITLGTSGDLVLEAHWNPASYVITLDAQGGKVSPASVVVTNLSTYGTLPKPAKAGADFVGWFTQENGGGVQVLAEHPVKLKAGQTLYANWAEHEYTLQLDDGGKGSTLSVTKDGQTFNHEVEKVHTGDVLNITVNAGDGYSVSRITIANKPAINGGNFRVASGYESQIIVIKPTLRVVNYTITYYMNGGVQGTPATGTSWARNYTVESPEIALPPFAEFDADGNIIENPLCPTKPGYYFMGWFEDAGFVTGIETIATGSTGNLSLYAAWGALERTVLLKGNYGGAAEDQQQIGLTDKTIKLDACSFAGNLERQDFRFLGWSSTPNGAVEYEDGAEYTVKPDGNVLYAIWHVANMQFVTIEVKNDKMVYGSNSEGIVLTPKPGYPYASTDVTLTYQWYKLDSNGIYVKYGEPITMTAQEAANPDGTNRASITMKNVAECGTFKCVLTAEGNTKIDATDASGKPINMVTTATGEGERAVSMEKAEYNEISFENAVFDYDKQAHSIAIGNAALPDGISVDYTGNGKTRAGLYEVVAIFTVPDASNYKPIESRKATMTITPKKITGVSFVGANPASPQLFDYVYNGSVYTVTATLNNILEGDDVRAALTDNSYAAAGSYIALVAGIEGADSGNYEMPSSLESVSQAFSIAKAKYDMSGVKFADKTVTYNGAKFDIFLGGTGLPAGVGASYSYVYKPFNNLSGATGVGNGGINAGTYYVTVTFAGDSDNYNAIAPMNATLTINKANFSLNYGEFKNSTVSYAVGTSYNPQIDLAGQNLSERIAAEYAYFKSNGGIFDSIQVSGGLSQAGVYKITARLRFLKDEDINNYNEIAEKSITFNISSLEVRELSVQNFSTRKYKVGEAFDSGDLVVTVFYADGTSEQLSAEQYTMEPAVFVTAGSNSIVVTYFGVSKSFDITVDKGDYDFKGVSAEDAGFVYDGTAKLPEISGELPEGVTAVYRFGTDGVNYAELPAGGLAGAGVYFIEISFTHGNVNYNEISAKLFCKLTIEKKEIGVVFDYGEGSSFVFNGTEYTVGAEASGVIDGETVALILTGNKAIDAGNYIAVASLDAELYQNYKLSAVGTSIDWTIAAQTVQAAFKDGSFVYTGSVQNVEVEIKDAEGNLLELGATIDFGEGVEFKNAGEYNAKIIGLKNADGSECVNYRLPEITPEHTYEIGRKSVAAVWQTSEEVEGVTVWSGYDATGKQLIYNGTSLSARLRAVFFDLDETFALTVNYAGVPFVNAGEYNLTAENANTNYDVANTAQSVKISPREVSAEFEIEVEENGATVWKKLTAETVSEYRRTAYALRAFYTAASGDSVALNVGVTANGAAAEFRAVGSYALSATAQTAEDGNYVLTNTELSGVKINAKTVTAVWSDPDDLTYDNTDKTVTATLSGVIEGDTVTVTLSGNAAKGAGTYTATAAISGDDADNYALNAESASHGFTIERRAVTVTIHDATMTYTGEEPDADRLAAITFDVTVGSLVAGDDLGISFAKAEGVDVGNYAVTGSAANGNYDVTFVGSFEEDTAKGLFTVTQAESTVNPVYNAKAYVGDARLNGSALGLSNGDTLGTIVFDDVTAVAGKAAGTYDFGWSFTPTDSKNHKNATGVVSIEVLSVELSEIKVTKNPGKLSYLVEQSFDPAGIEVTAYYNNGDTKKKTGEVSYTVNNADALTYRLTLSDNKITVSYTENEITKDCTINISVTDKEVVGIIVNTPPEKVNYIEGQTFADRGLTLEATYQDDSKEVVNGNWNVNLAGRALTVADTKVVVTYGGKTVEISITVAAKAVVSIAITTPPTKLEYIEGNSFDPSGIVVTATYNDETEAVVTNLSYDKTVLAFGDTAVKAGYTFADKTVYAEQAITVREKSIVSIAVTTPPTKTVYDAFETFDASGMVVTATYDNETTGEITNYTIDASGALTVDVTEVTVAVGEVSATVEITVKPVDYELSLKFEDKQITFNGTAHGIAVEGELPDGVSVTYYINGSETGVKVVEITEKGIYEITAKFTVTNPNYNAIIDMVATLTVSDLKIFDSSKLTLDESAGFEYDGAGHSPSIAGSLIDADGNGVSLADAGVTVTLVYMRGGEVVSEIKNAGVYNVVARFEHNNAEYADIPDKTFELTVGKATLTLNVGEYEIFEGAAAPSFGYTLSGFVGDDTKDNVSFTGSVTFATDYDRNDPIGDYAVTASSAPEFENYTVNRVAGKLSVKKYVDEIVFENAESVYDGTNQSVSATNLPAGVSVEYLVDGSKENAAKDVGIYTVTAKFIVADGSFKIDDKTVTLTIAPKTLTVVFPDKDGLVANGEELRPQIGAEGAVEGDEVGFGVIFDKSVVEAGAYKAKLSVANANYVLDKTTIEFTVLKSEVSGGVEGNESEQPDVIIGSEGGIAPDVTVIINSVTDEAVLKDYASRIEGELNNLYEIGLVDAGGQSYLPDGAFVVRLRMPDSSLAGDSPRVIRYNGDGTVTDMNAVVEGDYLVFTTDILGSYAIVSNAVIIDTGNDNNIKWIAGLAGGGALIAALAIVAIVMAVKKKSRR